MIWLAASLILYLVPSVLLTIRLHGRFEPGRWIVLFFLIVFASNVIIFQILTVLGIINRPGLYLTLEVAICVLLAFACLYKSAPPTRDQFNSSFAGFSRTEAFLVVCFFAILGGFFIVGITTAPNNLDSLRNHLPRIYYWLQHGSTSSWPATWYPQLFYPVGAHYQGMWLFLLGRSENLFFMVQWFSLVTITALVYLTARLLGYSRLAGLTTALIGLSFPAMLLQTYSFQGDLTVSALGMASVYFLFAYRKDLQLWNIGASFLALALALGTKQTAVFLLPAFAIFFTWWVINGRLVRKHLIPALGLLIGFLILFTSAKYIQNWLEVGSPMGNFETINTELDPGGSRLQKLVFNVPRYVYGFISVDGLPAQMETSLQTAKAEIFRAIDTRFQLRMESEEYLLRGYDPDERFQFDRKNPLSEDTSWFGPLSFLLLPAAILLGLVSKDGFRKQYAVFSLILILIYFTLVMMTRSGWQPYQGRYFILPVVVSLPLVGGLFPINKKAETVMVILLSFFVIFTAVNTFLFNRSKPLLTYTNLTRFALDHDPKNTTAGGPKTILDQIVYSSALRLSLQAPQDKPIYSEGWLEQVYYQNKDSLPKVSWVLNNIPDASSLSFYNIGYAMEYGLFGRNRTRDLLPLASLKQYDGNTYLLVSRMAGTSLIGRYPLKAESDELLIFAPLSKK